MLHDTTALKRPKNISASEVYILPTCMICEPSANVLTFFPPMFPVLLNTHRNILIFLWRNLRKHLFFVASSLGVSARQPEDCRFGSKSHKIALWEWHKPVSVRRQNAAHWMRILLGEVGRPCIGLCSNLPFVRRSDGDFIFHLHFLSNSSTSDCVYPWSFKPFEVALHDHSVICFFANPNNLLHSWVLVILQRFHDVDLLWIFFNANLRTPKTHMMNQLLIRCSVCFFTSSVMPCGTLPQKQNMSRLVFDTWSVCGTEHDLRSLKLQIVPGYRFVRHGFLNLDVLQGSNPLFLHSSVKKSGSNRWSTSICQETFQTCFIKLDMRKTFDSLSFNR